MIIVVIIKRFSNIKRLSSPKIGLYVLKYF